MESSNKLDELSSSHREGSQAVGEGFNWQHRRPNWDPKSVGLHGSLRRMVSEMYNRTAKICRKFPTAGKIFVDRLSCCILIGCSEALNLLEVSSSFRCFSMLAFFCLNRN